MTGGPFVRRLLGLTGIALLKRGPLDLTRDPCVLTAGPFNKGAPWLTRRTLGDDRDPFVRGPLCLTGGPLT